MANNAWGKGSPEYEKWMKGSEEYTKFLPDDAAYNTGINPNTGESADDFGNRFLGLDFEGDENSLGGDSVAQKLNIFASSFRNVLSRMYRKSTYTGNTQEDLDNGIPLKEVVEYGHHFIRTKERNYREYIVNGEYPGEVMGSVQIFKTINLETYNKISRIFVNRRENYEIEVHTHPTFDPLVQNYEGSRNIAPSSTDIIYFEKVKGFISFVEAETMQFALVVTNTKQASKFFEKSEIVKINNKYKQVLNESGKQSSESSINAAKAVLGLAKERGVAFYINWDKSNPNFKLQN